MKLAFLRTWESFVELDEFINLTIQMPGLRDVFYNNKQQDFIFLRNEIINKIGVEKFKQAIERLNHIMIIVNVEVFTEIIPGYGCKLIARRKTV
jgi:hypothetical protein